MRSVIETLEGAQDHPDWSVSGNAMRWVPPAGRVAAPVEPPARAVQVTIVADFSGFVAAVRQLGEELTRFFDKVEPKRDPRISAMRRAYRRRRGGRW